MPTRSTVITELAKKFKGKVSRCEVYDANVCTIRSVSGRPWELEPVSGEPFDQRLRFTRSGRKVTVLANKAYVHGSASGIFASRPFIINSKQKVGFRSELADTLSVSGERYPVFTEDGNVSSEQKDLLGRSELLSLIAQSGLRDGESLYFTRGEIGFYLKGPDGARVTRVIDRVIELARKVETTEKGLNLKLLPAQFHSIIPLIKKWAVADDSERDDLLAATPVIVLQSLGEEVSPFLNSIDSYLDSFGGKAPTEEAVALGRLAECAVEAKQRLNDKPAA